MDSIGDLIVYILEAIIFIIFGFTVLWLVGKVQRWFRNRRKKEWKQKKIKW